MTDTRPQRFCDVCGQLDDHPRHVLQLPGDSVAGKSSDEFLAGVSMGDAPIPAVEQLLRGDVRVRHMDCCAAEGCETCAETEKAIGALRGQKLIDNLAAERADREV